MRITEMIHASPIRIQVDDEIEEEERGGESIIVVVVVVVGARFDFKTDIFFLILRSDKKNIVFSSYFF